MSGILLVPALKLGESPRQASGSFAIHLPGFVCVSPLKTSGMNIKYRAELSRPERDRPEALSSGAIFESSPRGLMVHRPCSNGGMRCRTGSSRKRLDYSGNPSSNIRSSGICRTHGHHSYSIRSTGAPPISRSPNVRAYMRNCAAAC